MNKEGSRLDVREMKSAVMRVRACVLGGEGTLLGGDDMWKHLQFILVQKEAAEDYKKERGLHLCLGQNSLRVAWGVDDGGRPEARRPTGRLLPVTATGLTKALRAGRKVGRALRNGHASSNVLVD